MAEDQDTPTDSDKRNGRNEKILRCDEHHPLADCVSKLIYEVRELTDAVGLTRMAVREHDDKVIKFYEQNALLAAQIKTNNEMLEKVVKLLKETTAREAMVSQHLEEVLAYIAKNTANNSEEWFKKRLEEMMTAQTQMLEKNRKENAKLLWKLVGVIVTLALFIAGVTGNLSIPGT
jgi:N-dimethylarginine dimethylaminohydrolase